jgi:HSP20 family protein
MLLESRPGREQTASPTGEFFGRRAWVENGECAAEVTHPMDPIRTIRLRWAQGTLGDVTYTASSFSQYAPPTWQPPINAYRCSKSLRICVDLAGVDRSRIDLEVEGQRLILRGERDVPEPKDKEGRILQTIAMEIDYGSFLRVVQLPDEVDIDRVTAEQENGLLWIILLLKKS